MSSSSSMMRKRGWSIHSEGEHSHATKQSTMTEQSEETLTDSEKLKLLQNFPCSDNEQHDDDDENNNNKNNNNSDVIDMFGSSDDDDDDDSSNDEDDEDDEDDNHGRCSLLDDTNSRKKRKTNTLPPTTTDDDDDEEERLKLLEVAKGRLSKWAARLFDADRPRGLVEPPKVIPLNDEFLIAFGKREKEFDDKTGRIVEIDESNLDDLTDDDDDDDDDDKESDPIDNDMEHCHVKVVNLAYTTTKEKIMKIFSKYGVLVNLDLTPDPNNANLSLGRATLTYESKEGAEQCVEKMHEQCLDGRILLLSIPNRKNFRKSSNLEGPSSSKAASKRYYIRDISTKCYRCGQVGHIEADCVNEAQPKPCPLCGKLDHDDSRFCPFYKICFNCGVPGHINRECTHRRGLPKRMVCGLCFRSGHHRWNCPVSSLPNITTHGAICLVCQQPGHFMCQPMRWFFGLKGLTCFNCGREGHHGMACDRPKIDVLQRNSELACTEIQKAEALSLADEISLQSTKRARSRDNTSREGRPTQRQNHNNNNNTTTDRNRAKSLPPNVDFRHHPKKSTYGKIQTTQQNRYSDNHRNNRSSSTSPRHRGGGGGSGSNNNNHQHQSSRNNFSRGYQNNNNNNNNYNNDPSRKRGR